MKTVHATAHGPVSITKAHGDRWSWPNGALRFVENTVCMAVLLVCEVVVLGALLTAIYFAPWPVT